MPALDHCHPQIVRALEKDGWAVDSLPVTLSNELRSFVVDIRATRQTNGARQTILLAEVKCFAGRDATTTELYVAIGQYMMYRAMLSELRQNIPLVLAVPEQVFAHIFDSVALKAIADGRISMIVVDLTSERIVRWLL
jgi:hypothetical protein